jgi:hypothetical protein
MEELGTNVIVSFLFVYFIPTMVALARDKSEMAAILLLNLFIGWTFIGWFVTLALACANNNRLK